MVAAGPATGTVEGVGLRTTRLRDVNGIEVSAQKVLTADDGQGKPAAWQLLPRGGRPL